MEHKVRQQAFHRLWLTSGLTLCLCCVHVVQVKDVREKITSNDRALAEVTNTAATLKAHHATVMDKFQRLEAQVKRVQGCSEPAPMSWEGERQRMNRRNSVCILLRRRH